jgi:hypothetical protein
VQHTRHQHRLYHLASLPPHPLVLDHDSASFRSCSPHSKPDLGYQPETQTPDLSRPTLQPHHVPLRGGRSASRPVLQSEFKGPWVRPAAWQTIRPQLTDLRFFVNSAGCIRMIEAPEQRYKYYCTNSERVNEVFAEAFQSSYHPFINAL